MSARARYAKISRFLLSNFVWITIIMVYAAMGIASPFFFTFDNLENILIHMVGLGTLSLGLMFVLILGEIDLSVTSNGALSAFLGVYIMKTYNIPVLLGIIFILLFSGGICLINGLLSRYLGVPSLIATLSMDFILRGSLLSLLRGTTYSGFPFEYLWLGSVSIFGVRLVYVTYFLLALLTYFIFNHLRIGRRICLVGGDRNAALMGGLNEKRVALVGFFLCGIFSGLSGFLLSSRLGVVTPIFMQAYLLPAIAAPVIGGVSLFGGVGEVKGTVAGVFLLQTVSTGLIVVGISAYLLQAVQGFMIGIAICVDALRRKYYRIS